MQFTDYDDDDENTDSGEMPQPRYQEDHLLDGNPYFVQMPPGLPDDLDLRRVKPIAFTDGIVTSYFIAPEGSLGRDFPQTQARPPGQAKETRSPSAGPQKTKPKSGNSFRSRSSQSFKHYVWQTYWWLTLTLTLIGLACITILAFWIIFHIGK